MPNVEAGAALTYLISPMARVSLGYRVEQFWDVMPGIRNEGFTKEDRLFHGPFLQLTIVGN